MADEPDGPEARGVDAAWSLGGFILVEGLLLPAQRQRIVFVMQVQQESRGRGRWGVALIRLAAEWGRDTFGATAMHLNVLGAAAETARARELYEALGFEYEEDDELYVYVLQADQRYMTVGFDTLFA